MLREIRSLGFEWAELSHGIRISLLPGIFEAVDAGEIKISSLHNFCPLPMGVNHAAPNLYLFSSLDPRERENARTFFKTLERAARLKAAVVVLHLGAIDMKDYTDQLLEMVARRTEEDAEIRRPVRGSHGKTGEEKRAHANFVIEMLERLSRRPASAASSWASRTARPWRNSRWTSDYELLLAEFNQPGIGYWHDCGHAQIKENLGFIDHRDALGIPGAPVAGISCP